MVDAGGTQRPLALDSLRDALLESEVHLWPGQEHGEDDPVLPGGLSFTHGILPQDGDEDVEQAAAVLQDQMLAFGEKVQFLAELEAKWTYKGWDQEAARMDAAEERREAATAAEEAMFEVSSEDSDGVDPDFESDWGPNTREIYSACRQLEVYPNGEETLQQFSDMLRNMNGVQPTLTEELLVWNALRLMHVKTEAVHGKRWLTGCRELADGKGFEGRPSLAAFLHVSSCVAAWPGLRDAHRRKAQRWAGKSMTLFRKRVAALRAFGQQNPSWAQVNVAAGGRTVPVPTVLLHHAVACGPGSEPLPAAQSPAATTPACTCGPRHTHFPCDGSPARPHTHPPC